MSPNCCVLGFAILSLSVRGTAHAQQAATVPPAPASAPPASAPPAPPASAVAAPAESPTPAAPASSPPAAATPPVVSPAAKASPPLAAPLPAVRTVTSPGQAWVHVAVNRRDAWLEMRSYVDGGEFIRTCRAPCDALLQVEGREARVVAPGMTTSNIFRVAAGGGVAGVRVNGGSAGARQLGIITLALGIPVALAGMGLFAQGRVKDNTGLEAAGIAGLATGGLSIGISLPLLLLGTTRVRDANGSLIASQQPLSSL